MESDRSFMTPKCAGSLHVGLALHNPGDFGEQTGLL